MGIERSEAVRIELRCDVCPKRAQVYSWRTEGHDFDYPEGWTSFPESKWLLGDEEPEIYLCPEHAGLVATAKLVSHMIARRARMTLPTIEV